MLDHSIAIGVDVGKFECIAALHASPERYHFCPDPEGIAGFVDFLRGLERPVRIGLEATGGYEARLWEALDADGFRVRQLCPARVHAFARGLGRLAKSDGYDAQTIAAFVASQPGTGRVLPPRNIRRINALTTKRRQLIVIRKALVCQSRQTGDGFVANMDQAHLAFLQQQIGTLEAQIASLIDSDADLARKRDLLMSIPGIGPIAAITCLAEMPELGRLPCKAAGALAGLAPFSRDSGTKSGKRFIRGGRAAIRAVLYMAALSASRHNPAMKTFADRLKAKGKPAKQVIIAVARKLIELANTILARNSEWLPVASS